MYKKHRMLIEKILFDYYMVSSMRENEIYSPFPFYIDKAIFQEMQHATKVLDKAVRRIITDMLESSEASYLKKGEYPLKEEIFNIQTSLYPFFWTRYDAFVRRDGGIFFSEFNYDKPCAQREIAVSAMFETDNNPNNLFTKKFIEGFQTLWNDFRIRNSYAVETPRIAILIDPSHYEEVHLAHLYMDLLAPLGFECVIAGGDNFSVQEDRVKVFGKEIDIILRQYPTEFLHEVSNINEILSLFDKGKVLLINDPRAILGQAKSLFAYLWNLVEKDDGSLTSEEIKVIRSTIPHTSLFEPSSIPEDLFEKKDEYVIKAVYGRYSEEVYIGKMHSMEEWAETIRYVSETDRPHIIQEFCPIRPERVFKFDGIAYKEVEAFGNFGVYLVNGEFAGTCVRWSEDYLSLDESVWISPIGIRRTSLQTKNLFDSRRKEKWIEINESAAFEYGYTGGYTGNRESFSLQALVMEEVQYKELISASKKICGIFKKTTKLVQENKEILCPVLGISDRLQKLVTQSCTDCFTFIGRFDWIVDTKGNLRLLEYNSETPAGLMESMVISNYIHKEAGTKLYNPNLRLNGLVYDCFRKIINDYASYKGIGNIGIVSSTYYEDWYNTTIIYDQVKQLPYNFIMGEVSGLRAKEGKLYLYDVPLDAVYRYYPLDWLEQDPYYEGVIDAFEKDSLSINPPSTLISQSKAFFALVWELLEQGFYNSEETDTIRKYIVRTALSPKKLGCEDYCIKPYFGREGQDVLFSIYNQLNDWKRNSDVVFQERVDIQPVVMDMQTTEKCLKEISFPVVGAYIVDEHFGGIYTRIGSRITNKTAVYIPTFVNV